MCATPEFGPARAIPLALLFADLSGYTALTETHGALQASESVLRFVTLAKQCLEPGVTLVNSIGDDVFCAGPDILGIVRTALQLRDRAAREPGFPRVRIGLHHGEILEREGRLFGSPINLAARLSDRAGGGRILCTEPVALASLTLAAIDVVPLGTARFRNVTNPVLVFELVRTRDARRPSSVDPVCRMQVTAGVRLPEVAYGGVAYHFCSEKCARAFAASPETYLARSRFPETATLAAGAGQVSTGIAAGSGRPAGIDGVANDS